MSGIPSESQAASMEPVSKLCKGYHAADYIER